MSKPTRLHYTGRLIDRGDGIKAPDRYFMGVPARNLDEADIALLDAATLKNIMGGEHPLYVDPDAEAEDDAKKGSAPAAASKDAPKADAKKGDKG